MSLKHKYFLFKYNTDNKTIKKIIYTKKLGELKEQIIGKKFSQENEFVLLKLQKEPKYKDELTGPLSKIIGGPIKLTITMYKISSNNILKRMYEEKLNKAGELDLDKRNSQFLYLTKEYLNNGIDLKDLEKVALWAAQYNLEKRPLAPKLINQVL